MSTKKFQFLWLLLAALIQATRFQEQTFLAPPQTRFWPPETYIIPPKPQKGEAVFITNNSQGPFDAPKSSLINSTVLEWWYFDATSEGGDQGIAVWFFNTDPSALGFDIPSSNWLLVHTRFTDGTGQDFFIPAGEAIVQTIGDGSSGVWTGAGGWSGSPDLSKYEFRFDNAEFKISGNVIITSHAPAHFAMAPATDPYADEMGVENLGWAVSIPAGDATAHVEVDGKLVSFNHGSGYHDHNWGVGLASFRSWYAVRAEAGPYSMTVVNALTADGTYGTTYLSYKGEPILNILDGEAVSIRPWGNGSEYPPKGFDPQPLGVTILLEDRANDVSYSFNFTSRTSSEKIEMGKGLAKWFGTLEGGRSDGATYKGPGMFEWLDLAI